MLQYEDPIPVGGNLNFLKLIAKGRLGMVGAQVGVYVFKKGVGKLKRTRVEKLKELKYRK